MGSVIDECECPKCKNPNAYRETYYKRGTEIVFCERCGYNCDEDGKETGGLGGFRIGFNGGGTMGGFTKDRGFKDMEKEFKKSGFKNDNGKKATEVTYTFQKNGKWYEKDLIKDTITPMIKKEIIERLR